MGATNFIHEIKGRTPKEAFDYLIAEANQEYGTSPYNGSINTCDMGSCKKRFDKFNETNMKAARKFIDDNDYGHKWTADYVEVGISHYLVTTVKKVNEDGASKKLKMMYAVHYESDWRNCRYTGKAFKTKTEADKYALEQALKTGCQHFVKKEYVALDDKDGIVSKTVIETKKYKTKPNLKPLPNRKIEPVKQYIFYGWASC